MTHRIVAKIEGSVELTHEFVSWCCARSISISDAGSGAKSFIGSKHDLEELVARWGSLKMRAERIHYPSGSVFLSDDATLWMSYSTFPKTADGRNRIKWLVRAWMDEACAARTPGAAFCRKPVVRRFKDCVVATRVVGLDV